MIKNFISSYALPIIIGILISTGGALWWQSLKIDDLNQTIKTQSNKISELNTANENMRATINNLESDIEAEKAKLADVSDLNREYEQKLRDSQEQLEQAKGRQEIVWKKPTLVQRMIRSNYSDFVNQLSCITGAKEKCSEQ